jgi:hypothetical protein
MMVLSTTMNDRSPFLIKPADMKQGMVVRMLRDGDRNNVAWGDSYSDHTVINVTESTVKLARPYVLRERHGHVLPRRRSSDSTSTQSSATTASDWLVVNDRNIAGVFTFEDIQAAEERGKAAAKA